MTDYASYFGGLAIESRLPFESYMDAFVGPNEAHNDWYSNAAYMYVCYASNMTSHVGLPQINYSVGLR